jgi:hypothetical protein
VNAGFAELFQKFCPYYIFNGSLFMQYRPEIDGLRAISVLPVILFHAGFTLFSGGFVGVDIFFVISGFLITSIIASEINEKKFTFIGFYERRALWPWAAPGAGTAASPWRKS